MKHRHKKPSTTLAHASIII